LGEIVDLHAYMRAIRRFWWVVLLGTLLGTGLGGLVAQQATPLYEGEVTFFAITPNSAEGNPLQGDEFGQQRVNTYVKLLASERLADRVLEETNLRISPSTLAEEITGSADLNTVLFTATVRDPSRQRALRLTDAVATEFPELVDEIETQNGAQKATVNLDVVSGPSLTEGTVGAHRRLDVAVGALAGLLIGIALAFLLALMDKSVRRPESLRESTRTPVLGVVPGGGGRKHPVVVDVAGASEQAEAFRRVRTNVQFVDVGRKISVLAVTSAAAHEGRSSTAINLALAFAEAGRKVVLVDGDLRAPMVAKYLRLSNAAGLSDVLAGQATVEEVLQGWGDGALTVLTSGPVPPNPAELLGSGRMEDVLAALRGRFDLVVIDTPPLLPFTDAVIASTQADGVVVVVRYGKTRDDDVTEVMDSLAAVDARVLGTVLNRAPGRRPTG
jgi:capsular exopolysaccharide synthesis family protein